MTTDMGSMRIGVVGFGHLGRHLVTTILSRPDVELAFVWNRTPDALRGQVEERYVITNLSQCHESSPDLIVEVAHLDITATYGETFLEHADYMVGSPTALSDPALHARLSAAALRHGHGVYVPSGAFWGGEDIRKMADRGTLQKLKITMTKHPSCFKLRGRLKELNAQVKDTRTVLYDGPVRELCPLAPNNVNTMAAASLAAHTLGMDGVQGCIVADPRLTSWHIVEVEAWGPGDLEGGSAFHVHTVRRNPADLGKVTGNATYESFVSSMLGAHGKGHGLHLC